MTDFWIDVILTILVTFATVMADWLANLLVTSTRGLAKVDKVLGEATNSRAKIDAIQEELDKYKVTNRQMWCGVVNLRLLLCPWISLF